VLQGRFSNNEAATEVLPFQCEEFREAWNKWRQYLREINKKLVPTSIKEQLACMEEWGEERSMAAINNTIRQGYQGLVEPPGHKSKESHPINTGRRTCTIEEV